MPRLARFLATALSTLLVGGILASTALVGTALVDTASADAGSPTASVVAGCVAQAGTTNASVSYFSSDDEATGDLVAWVVTSDAGVVDQGTVTLAAGEGQFGLDDLVRGDYRVSFTPAGDQAPSATYRFTVVGCVTTQVSCKAVTFANPAGNPPVDIEYSPPFDADSPDEDGLYVRVAPGTQVTRRTALPAIGWQGIVWIDDGGTYRTAYPGSDWDLPVPHDCSRPLSSLVRRCVNHRPRLEVTFAREGSDQPVRFTVSKRSGKNVAGGEPKGRRTTATAKLPGPGRYTYRSYLDFSEPYEEVAFRIKTCGGRR